MDDNGGFLSSLLTNTNPPKDPLFFSLHPRNQSDDCGAKKNNSTPLAICTFPGLAGKISMIGFLSPLIRKKKTHNHTPRQAHQPRQSVVHFSCFL